MSLGTSYLLHFILHTSHLLDRTDTPEREAIVCYFLVQRNLCMWPSRTQTLTRRSRMLQISTALSSQLSHIHTYIHTYIHEYIYLHLYICTYIFCTYCNHYATMLQYYNASMLQGYNTTMLQCYNATMLQCYDATMLSAVTVYMSLLLLLGQN